MVDKLKDKKNPTPPTSKVNDELSDVYKKLKIAPGEPLNYEQLKTSIGNLSIRGTSSLYRSNICLKKTEKLLYPTITDSFSVNSSCTHTNTSRCPNCSKKQYHITSTSYTLSKNGTMCYPIELDNDDCKRVSREVRK